MRPFLRFFFSPSPPEPPEAALEVFFAALEPPSEVVFAGAFEAVEAGALPAVEAGLGAIADDNVMIGVFVRKGCEAQGLRQGGRKGGEMEGERRGDTRYIYRRVVLVWRDASTR